MLQFRTSVVIFKKFGVGMGLDFWFGTKNSQNECAAAATTMLFLLGTTVDGFAYKPAYFNRCHPKNDTLACKQD